MSEDLIKGVFGIVIMITGLLAAIRAYWVHNLINDERGKQRDSFFKFIWTDDSIFGKYFIIRPFLSKNIKSKNKSKVNKITYSIYILILMMIILVILFNVLFTY